MGRMSEICMDIENMFFVDGMDVESIAEELNVPLDMVKNYIEHYDFDDGVMDYDDSMDGDFDSAMASAGYGTDEDYGGDCDHM